MSALRTAPSRGRSSRGKSRVDGKGPPGRRPRLLCRKNILKMHARKVHIVSLGCPKNLVDSEVMAGVLAENGYLLTDRPEEAAVILINTCAFILPAREEAIAEILRMAAWKQGGDGPCTHLVVTGCLPQRYGKELEEALPEVDLFLGTAAVPHIGRHLDALLSGIGKTRRRSAIGRPTFLMNAGHRRLISTPAGSAYIKIADGCSNHCSYCVIPSIRGKARSRTIDDIVKEAEGLAARGIRELIVTAQDTTAYGLDLKGETDAEPPAPGAGRHRRPFVDPSPLHLPRPSDGGASPDDRGREKNLSLPGYPHPAQR